MAKYLRSATPAALAVGLDALFSGQLKFVTFHKVILPSKAAFAMEKFVYVRIAEYRRSATLAALAMGLDALFNDRIKFITRSKFLFLLKLYPDPINSPNHEPSVLSLGHHSSVRYGAELTTDN